MNEEQQNQIQNEKEEKPLEEKFKPVDGEPKKGSTFNVASNLSKSFKPPTEQPIDLIKDKMKKTGQLPGQRPSVFVGPDGKPLFNEKTETKEKDLELPNLPSKTNNIKIDGYEIPLSGVPQLDMLTCFAYMMAIHFSKIDPEVDRILKVFKFNFPDAAGKMIYPIPETISTKKKNKKRKKNKRRKNAKS